MKKITLNFVDFPEGFDNTDNFFYNLISKRFQIEISREPEYLFFSCYGYEHLNYKCIKIFYTGENITPNFNLCEYAIGFDYIDFGERYFRLPLYFLYENDLKKAINKHKSNVNFLDIKIDFCNFIYSNFEAHPIRIEFFDLLTKYKKVDSGGKVKNNLGYLVGDKFKFQLKYKFTIAFENSFGVGYTTEKIIQAFAAKTIPIYWGNPKIEEEFNPKSFINVHNFNSLEEVVQQIIKIDNDSNLFSDIINENIFNSNIFVEEKLNNLEIFLNNIFITKKDKFLMEYSGQRREMISNDLKLVSRIKRNLMIKLVRRLLILFNRTLKKGIS